jgi:hypothetical protein
MPYGTTPVARQLEHGKSNRFLAALPPRDFSLLAPHLRTITLERGVMLHDVGEEIEHVYFPHTGMVSLVAVMQSGATVETATIGAEASSAPAPPWAHDGRSAGRSFSCRGRPRGSRLPGFMPLPTKVRPFATSSCATTICCWRKSNSRSRATRSMRSRPDFAAGCCKRTIASTAMRSR